MPAVATAKLPLSATYTPGDQAEVADTLRQAFANRTPVYPLGGGTALNCGTLGKTAGWGIATEKLTRIVDYPARDMTITVEAGITIDELQRTLAAENQFLPVDVPQSAAATLGGAVAVNASGPRRFGQGTLRDYVIGVSAVDGTGTEFKAGGRVVKNVAGYDFCKLLVGSLGTLAVVTQLTLKVKPRPAASLFFEHELNSFADAETIADALVRSKTTPTAVQVLFDPGRKPRFLVGLEGTAAEIEWMADQLRAEWSAIGFASPQRTDDAELVVAQWRRLTDFGTFDGDAKPAPVLRLTCRPSRTIDLCGLVISQLPEATLAADPMCGVVLAQLPDLPTHELAKPLIRTLQPAAIAASGECVVWNYVSPDELTRQLCWGPARDCDAVLRRAKTIFDPKGLLNPGRFIFG